MVLIEIVVVLLLIAVNGVLAMSELAVVSARRGRLQAMAAVGSSGAAAAIRLAENPGRFLSTAQIGITLVGILAGAFSGATISERLAGQLWALGVAEPLSHTLAFVAVVAIITYLSLIIGELVPKQVALRDAERVAAIVARPMERLARMTSPIVALLDWSSRLCLRLVGARAEGERSVTEDEIRAMVAEAESAGVVEPQEKAMIGRVMRLGDRSVRAIMTPRGEVELIDLEGTMEEALAVIRRSAHARFPASRHDPDRIEGVLMAKDVLVAAVDGQRVALASLLRAAPTIIDTADALAAMDVLKQSPIDLALVFDEYGHFEGIVTAGNLLGAIAGEFAPQGDDVAGAVQRDDGSWLFDGPAPADTITEHLSVPLPDQGSFHTVAGFALSRFERVPRTGESFVWDGWRFEIVDMDGRRIDKVLATRLSEARVGHRWSARAAR